MPEAKPEDFVDLVFREVISKNSLNSGQPPGPVEPDLQKVAGIFEIVWHGIFLREANAYHEFIKAGEI